MQKGLKNPPYFRRLYFINLEKGLHYKIRFLYLKLFLSPLHRFSLIFLHLHYYHHQHSFKNIYVTKLTILHLK